jgi:hypothetical protein
VRPSTTPAGAAAAAGLTERGLAAFGDPAEEARQRRGAR